MKLVFVTALIYKFTNAHHPLEVTSLRQFADENVYGALLERYVRATGELLYEKKTCPATTLGRFRHFTGREGP